MLTVLREINSYKCGEFSDIKGNQALNKHFNVLHWWKDNNGPLIPPRLRSEGPIIQTLSSQVAGKVISTQTFLYALHYNPSPFSRSLFAVKIQNLSEQSPGQRRDLCFCCDENIKNCLDWYIVTNPQLCEHKLRGEDFITGSSSPLK